MGNKDATDNGVSDVIEETLDTDDESQEEMSGTGHANELERLAGLREEEFEKESGVSLDRDDSEDEDESEQPSEETEEEIEADDAPPTDDEMVEIVVDGEKQTVPRSEALEAGIRALQKQSAADKRLEEATRANKEAQALLEEAKKTTRPPVQDETDAEPDDTASTDVTDAEERLAETRMAYRNAIQYGTDEEVDEAIIEYENAQHEVFMAKMGAQGATPQTEDVVDQVADKLEERKVINRLNLPVDEGGYKDLMDDPVLYVAVRMTVQGFLDSGKPNVWDTYKEAGDHVRQTYGSGEQPSETTDAEPGTKPTSTKEKTQRKREIDNIPAANAKTESTAQPQKRESPGEIVESMRRSRPGQHI